MLENCIQFSIDNRTYHGQQNPRNNFYTHFNIFFPLPELAVAFRVRFIRDIRGLETDTMVLYTLIASVYTVTHVQN